MSFLQPVDRSAAPPAAKQLLDGVEKKLGMVPNLIATMAQSKALASGYLGLSQSLSGGVLPAQLRERIALAVSQANNCGYCTQRDRQFGRALRRRNPRRADRYVTGS